VTPLTARFTLLVTAAVTPLLVCGALSIRWVDTLVRDAAVEAARRVIRDAAGHIEHQLGPDGLHDAGRADADPARPWPPRPGIDARFASLVADLPLGTHDSVRLFGPDGRLLARHDPASPTAGGLGTGPGPGFPGGAAAWRAAPGQVHVAWYTSGEGVAVLGAAAHLPHLDWTLLVERPAGDALAVPAALARTLWAALGLVVLVIASGAAYWARCVDGPLRDLTSRARELAGAREPVPASVAARDLHGLEAALDGLSDRLQALDTDVRLQARHARLGQAALGVVHDLSTPLQNLGNSCRLLTRSWNDLEYRATFARTVDRELAHIRCLLDELHREVRGSATEPGTVGIGPGLAAAVHAMQPAAMAAGITLRTDFTSDPVLVEGDRVGLDRIYRNLLENAIEATPPGGRVLVRTRREGREVRVEIADTGCGIAPGALASVFDDFATTKAGGLGVGLAVTRRLIERMRGTVSAASTPGAGSTFTLRLPLATAHSRRLAAG
jgi:signal transduction histidine kinase